MPSLWEERVRTRRGSAAQELVGTLLEHPIVDIAAVEAITGASRARSYDAINAVEDAGILHEITRWPATPGAAPGTPGSAARRVR